MPFPISPSFLLSPYSLYKIARFTKKKILSLEPTELFITSGENELLPTYTVFWKNNYSLIFEQAVERIEGDGGVRAPSLVELTIEDSEFTVVGRVKGRDEALQDKIHHLRKNDVLAIPASSANDAFDGSMTELKKKKKSVESSSLNEESVTDAEDLDEHANEEEEVE
ncbi:hypothetical protein IGI04_019162 [Brassica rapa subsp. trilocularis]|uniref:Uncharacterized protein n=1 Tax=Brassica rapa subsp. trilocularis TaxID=1813537 RepID=A0ABQ7MGN8_BRACM|nr:hypothetical protein IGI04_019162 [Brassica rapa subsp. trilocularis]